MTHMRIVKAVAVSILVCTLSTIGQAQIIVTFEEDIPNAPSDCGDMWIENQIPMEVLTCNTFDYGGGEIGMAPASFTLKTEGIAIDSVCVTWTDFCGTGCTSADFVSDGNSVGTLENILVGSQESQMFVNDDHVPIQNINIASSEGFIQEVKIFGEFGGSTCPTTLAVTDMLIQTTMMSTFEASQLITSDATLDLFADFTFRSQEVELLANFTVPDMVAFEVQVGPCVN